VKRVERHHQPRGHCFPRPDNAASLTVRHTPTALEPSPALTVGSVVLCSTGLSVLPTTAASLVASVATLVTSSVTALTLVLVLVVVVTPAILLLLLLLAAAVVALVLVHYACISMSLSSML
jgi:hypothetical protein